MRRFGELLAEALGQAAISQRAFAARSGTPISTVNEVIAGRRKPPRHRIGAWADLLHLEGERRRTWERAALLAHAEPALAALVDEQAVEIARLNALLAQRQAAEPAVPYRPDP